jgi:hypothetical protein
MCMCVCVCVCVCPLRFFLAFFLYWVQGGLISQALGWQDVIDVHAIRLYFHLPRKLGMGGGGGGKASFGR